MSALVYKLRLVIAGILVAATAAAVGQINSGSGLSTPPFDGRAESIISGDLADARLSSNVPLLDAADNNFTGTMTLTRSVSVLRLVETGATADEGVWDLRADGDALQILTRSDALGLGETALNMTRVGNTVGELALSGDTITANGESIVPIRAHKSADTARTSTTTYADDPHLSVAVNSGGDYAIEAYLIVTTANGTGDFRMRFNEGSGATVCDGSFTIMEPETAVVSTTGFCDGVVLNGSAAETYRLQVSGTLVDAPNTTIALQWAQAVSDAGATTLEHGSWLRVTEL